MPIKIKGAEKLDPQIKTLLNLVYLSYVAAFNMDETIAEAKKLGYSILSIKNDLETGYFGLAFQDKKNNVIITHRGTDSINLSGKFSTINDIANNIATTVSLKNISYSMVTDVLDDLRLALVKIPLQSEIAYDFIKQIKSDHPNSNIIQVGHSLGGNLAEYCYAKSGQTIKTYSFDSPGLEIIPEIDNSFEFNNNSDKSEIHYYMSPGPNMINSAWNHIDSDNSTLHKLFYPIAETISGISLFQYGKITLLTHSNMLLIDSESTIKDVDSWPVGFNKALEYFFSRENKDEWRILLDSYWQKICTKLGIEDPNSQQEFDKFFDHFAKNYLDPTKGTWKDIIPFNNLPDLLDEYSNIPIYSKPFNFIYGSLKSIYSSYKNFKPINEDLVDQYVKYYRNPDQEESAKNFIEQTWDNIVKMHDFVSTGNYIPTLIDVVVRKLGFPSGAADKYINDKIELIGDNLNAIISTISNFYGNISEYFNFGEDQRQFDHNSTQYNYIEPKETNDNDYMGKYPNDFESV